ncbi:hypothetical protein FNF27_04592 [Cafeteria roenbergensis]|uniref:Bile salt export pump n=1 Tax=Cafeteria roenbergensis TaxID=33653 RepID=A0A5A8E7Q2_CAFRO|nr:hypothetical protein FNF27_04592 [Cafeteria roenbergensis]
MSDAAGAARVTDSDGKEQPGPDAAPAHSSPGHAAAPSPDAAEAARKEGDVQSAIAREREQLLSDTTFCRLLCPRRREETAASAAGKSSPDAKKGDVSRVPVFGSNGLFRFAESSDIVLYAVAMVCAAGVGVALPMFSLVFGQLLDALNSPDPAVISENMNAVSLSFLYIAIAVGVLTWGEIALPTIAAERQAIRMRLQYARAIVRQEVGYFETEQDPAEVSSLLVDSSVQVVSGIGESTMQVVQAVSTAVAGLILGFTASWDLALVILAVMPVMVLPILVLRNARGVSERVNSDAYARAQSVASEALSNIRTVFAFGGQEAESRRYNSHLALAQQVAMRAGRAIGFGMGLLWLVIMSAYAAGMAFGAHRIRVSRQDNPLCAFAVVAEGATADCYTPGTLMQTFFAVLIGGSALGQIAPALGTISAATAAAARIFATIDRRSAIDPMAATGLASDSGPSAESSAVPEAPPRARGLIEFRDVSFAFPSDPDRLVLRSFSVTVRPGETLALVGESGSGKSTIVQLLMRFYDPQSGVVLLDGKDIKEYDVAWLRSQMGLVSQEPSLFSTSIEENIALGLPSYRSNFGEVAETGVSVEDKAASDEASLASLRSGTGRLWGDAELSQGRTVDGLPALPPTARAAVLKAAKAASAHAFVEALPRGYRTLVGDGGGQLSGGQKQRVAIARALVRKPSIFIGDEATSALDSESERQVSRAIDRLLSGPGGSELTSILIAHRLSTVTRATTIVVLDSGRKVEQGSHEELMRAKGVYHALAAGQGLADEAGATGTPADGAAAEAGGAVPASPSAISAGGVAGRGVGVSRSRRASSAADTDDGQAGADERAMSELLMVRARVDTFLAGGTRTAADALFFGLLDGATGPPMTDAEAADAALLPDSALTGDTKPLSRSLPRVVLLQSAFLEMAESEKQWLLQWWLGIPADRALELIATAGKGPAGIAEAVAQARAGKGGPVRLLPESESMAKACRDAKTALWEATPEAVDRALMIPPARARNSLLDKLLTASRQPVPFNRIMGYQRPEALALAAALLAAAVAGSIMPVYALGLSDILTVLYKTGEEFEQGVLFYCLLFVGIGVGSLVAHWVQTSLFVFLGARLTTRLRKLAFRKLLRQEVAYFDYPSNAAGQLTARLAGDSALVRAATGERLGVTLAGGVSLIAGLAIAFSATWQLSLIVMAIVPALAFGSIMKARAYRGFGGGAKAALESGARILDEAARSNRTVAGLGVQRHVVASFERSLEGPRRDAVAQGVMGGLAMGVAQFLNYAAFSLVFWAGSRFVADGVIEVNAVFRAFFGLSFGVSGSASAGAMSGDIGKAGLAAASIFAIVDRTPKMAPTEDNAAVLASVAVTGGGTSAAAGDGAAAAEPGAAAPASAPGVVEFHNVSFSYPARPEAVALRNFSATFRTDSTIGLVGPSGSGKSTIVQLLMRFYDPDSGTILLDGKDLKEYNIVELRERMGLVGQEPALFSDTVHYNIAYGRRGGTAGKPLADLGLATGTHASVAASRGEVEAAAKSAFAHEFIQHRLPLGYSTFVGNQGSSRLSGGQKQRIAIARALVRKPGFLIGDEVTSALDTKSEQEVQRALDRLLAETKRKDLHRTSVFVAHRLSTLKDVDNILVLEDGELKEQGSHAMLLEKGGLYSRLAKAQQLAGGATSPGAAGESGEEEAAGPELGGQPAIDHSPSTPARSGVN